MVDSPDDAGPSRQRLSGSALRSARGKGMLGITASAMVALAGIFTSAALLHATGMGLAPDFHIPPPLPFPSSAASSPAAVPTASKRTVQLAPSVAPVQNTTPPPSPMPGAASPLTASPSMTSAQQAVTATYLVIAQGNDGFEGEVQVVNNGSSPIYGWQIVVALRHDLITSFSNASGYVSNHILLLRPAGPNAEPVAAGGTLSVFFAAEGTQTTPELCAFNNFTCA